MATYDSIHTGEQVDEAVGIVLNNKGKGSATQPIYLDADGEAQNVNVDANPTDNSANLVQSGGVFTQLSTKYAKADISTDPNLGTSNTVIPSQGAVKTYVDTELAGKQDVITAGDGIVKDGNTLSISTDNDFMTVGKLDNKWSHFVSGLDMGHGIETIEKMENAKRSTFDLSKFTVVGSPNITNDGIASGFSGSNYLRTPIEISITSSSDIIFKIRYKYSTVSGNDGILSLGGFTNYPALLNTSNGSLQFFCGNGANDVITSGKVIFGEEYDFLIHFDKGTVRCYYKLISDDNYISMGTRPLSKDVINTVKIGYVNSDYYARGSIDLKQFSITVDGVEVFSGNKTGIDTIKPDDYTVVGTPTISTDGIADGFSAENYISIPDIDINGKDFEFMVKVKTPATNTTQDIVASTTEDHRIVLGWSGQQKFYLSTTGDFSYPILYTDIKLNNNAEYYAKIGMKGDKWFLSYSTNGIDWISVESTRTNQFTDLTNMRIGNRGGGNIYTGSIDLNTFKVYVDGNLVYQPCLKIPYTQTKDGKKIVDYNYKSRVEDEYTQAGFTPYYTLATEGNGNYTVVGSPTISSDFVASGFSAQSYLQLPNISFNGKNFEVVCGLTTAATTYSTTETLYYIRTSGGLLRLFFAASDNKLSLTSLGSGSLPSFFTTFSTGTLATNTKYLTKVGIEGTQIYISTSTDGINWTTVTQSISSNPLTTIDTFRIGVFRLDTVQSPFTDGSIDLNQFSITVGDKLAYQAVIPLNYTMATVKESAIVDSYENGINKWTKLANLTCKQQGSCTSGTAVTFTKPYIDTNYALSVPYSAKTKTGFTPSATGDWIANGKVDLNA